VLYQATTDIHKTFKVLELEMEELDRFCSYIHHTSTDNPEGH